MKIRLFSILLAVVSSPSLAWAAPWVEDKAFFTENASLASSKVDAADLNGDGTIDLVFANGAGFDKGDNTSDLPQQAFINDAGVMVDVSASIFGGVTRAGRAVKLRDLDRDGDNDIILGTTWETQSQLYLNDGGGSFSNVTDMNLPQGPASVGDLEVGDVDGDGDLDLVLSNWGPALGQTVGTNSGGVTLLWKQMGEQAKLGDATMGLFEDVTVGQMPSFPVRWSWDLEFVDTDNDYDLDIVISAYAGDKASLFLFTNDGAGTFSDTTAGNVPQGKNGLDVEPMDLNDDGAIDLISLHDGVGGRNRMLLNDAGKPGTFKVEPDIMWPKLSNPVSFDTAVAFYDLDSNNVPDIVIGAFQNTFPDRLVYDTTGKKKQPIYKANTTAFQELKVSGGTFAITLADFNNDTRLDVAMAQNENAFDKKVLLASEEVPLDTVAPWLTNIEPFDIQGPGTTEFRLRAHDNKSPLMLHDFKQTNNNEGFPYVESWLMEPVMPYDDNPGMHSTPGQWYGEYLWKVQFEVPDQKEFWARICAIDTAGNKRCTDPELYMVPGGTDTNTDTDTDSASNTDTMTASNTDSDSAVSATVTVSESDTQNTNSMSDTDGTVSNSNTDGTVSETAPTESNSLSNSESDTAPTESNSDNNGSVTQSDTDGTVSDSNSDSIDTLDATDLDDDGCGCDTDGSPAGGVLSSLALLGLLGIRRRRNT